MWNLRSLAFETDLFLVAASGGDVVDRGHYVVARTSSNPDYWWGNFLLYRDPPEGRAAARDGEASWRADKARELPTASATLLAWDRPDGETGAPDVMDAFVREGFEIDVGCILTATRARLVRPPRLNDDVVVAPLRTDDDWRAATRSQIAAFAARRSGTMDDLRTFIERQHATYRSLQERGLGQWWGARVGGVLAGSLGLARVSGTLGRFQLVGVDPAFGRQGVCSSLVYAVAKRALDEQGLETLVMAADATYHAAKVYESVGFRPAERLVALIQKPPQA